MGTILGTVNRPQYDRGFLESVIARERTETEVRLLFIYVEGQRQREGSFECPQSPIGSHETFCGNALMQGPSNLQPKPSFGMAEVRGECRVGFSPGSYFYRYFASGPFLCWQKYQFLMHRTHC